MKLRLLSLVLLGIILLDVTQARTIEKKEINEEDYPGKREVNDDEDIEIEWDNSVCSCRDGEKRRECKRCDDNGCEHVSNCNVKRQAIPFANKLHKIFKANQDSNCKCMNHGYCMARKDKDSEYIDVFGGCGERKCYTHCDTIGCRKVCDGDCKCNEYPGYCESCDDKGCKQVSRCLDSHASLRSTRCKECKNDICEKKRDCNQLCNDDVEDILIPEKCLCKSDENGKETCEMCGKYECKPVTDCSRFATCKLDHTANTYRRCYGFNHGESHCRTLYSAVEFKKRDEEWDRELNDEKSWSCECMSDGSYCKICGVSGCIKTQHCALPEEPFEGAYFNVTAHLN